MILIVDDKPENIFSLKSILELNKFPVDSASSGEQALRKILKQDYSLIILDVQMPEMDGFEVAEMIQSYSRSRDTPIIFLSAVNKEKSFITRGYKAGAMDYITKPVDPDILLLKVSSLYAMSEQKAELKRTQQNLLSEIEARKRSQAELAAKNEELYSVMESMPQIAFTLSTAGEVEYINKKWIEFIGNTREFPQLYPGNPDSRFNWNKMFREGKEFSAEVKLKEGKTDQYRNFLLKVIPVSGATGITKWVGTFTDIQQQKLVNELLENKVQERTSELSRKNKELELFNQELQQVTWVLSHDLKEPVRKILTYGNLIKERQLMKDKETIPYFNRIIESSERMSALINDLLDFSRMQHLPHYEKVDLNQIIEQVLADIESQVDEFKAKISVDKLPEIEASPVEIRQLFQNLISNSIKFSKPGVPPVIEITSEYVDANGSVVPGKGRYCRIIVADNGIGFNEKFLDKMFQVFQRLENNGQKGTGIGLAIVKKIVERHNGTITAKSSPDNGARFIVVLPLKNKNQYA